MARNRAVHTPPQLDGVPPGLRPLAARCLDGRPERRPRPGDLLDEVGPPETAEWLPEQVRTVVEERRTVIEYVAGQSDRKAAFEDLLWAILNTKEFLFNH